MAAQTAVVDADAAAGANGAKPFRAAVVGHCGQM